MMTGQWAGGSVPALIRQLKPPAVAVTVAQLAPSPRTRWWCRSVAHPTLQRLSLAACLPRAYTHADEDTTLELQFHSMTEGPCKAKSWCNTPPHHAYYTAPSDVTSSSWAVPPVRQTTYPVARVRHPGADCACGRPAACTNSLLTP